MDGIGTRHQEKLWSYWRRGHAFRSMAKLCEVVGLSSTASVFDLVGRLKDARYVQRVGSPIPPPNHFFARPVAGAVHACLPQSRQDDDDFEVLSADDYLVPEPKGMFLARVKGDSMQDASMLENDIVVDVQVTRQYRRQQFHRRFYQQLAEAAFSDIHAEGELQIRGLVVRSFRSYRR